MNNDTVTNPFKVVLTRKSVCPFIVHTECCGRINENRSVVVGIDHLGSFNGGSIGKAYVHTKVERV